MGTKPKVALLENRGILDDEKRPGRQQRGNTSAALQLASASTASHRNEAGDGERLDVTFDCRRREDW